MSHELSETQRQLNNLAAYGTIAAVDHARGMVRVNVAGRLTDWLPAPGLIGQNFRAWAPLRVGTQVLVAAPSGDPANGVIAQVLYSQGLAPPNTTGDVDIIQWNDGTRVEYDTAGKKLIFFSVGDLTVEATGDLRLKAGGTIHIDGAAVRVFEGG